jgi:hypothetical protein
MFGHALRMLVGSIRRKAGSKQYERFAEVRRYFMRWRAFAFLGIVRCDPNSQTNPSCRASLDVAHFVSQDRGLNRIEVKIGHGLQYHTRVGLAPRMIAAVLADAMEGVIRTVIHSSDRYVFRFKAITHPSRQVFIGGFIEITTADAGLVGDDNDQPAQLVGPEASQLENSRDELELVRPVNVATVNVDHAVAVKKKGTLIHGYANPYNQRLVCA